MIKNKNKDIRNLSTSMIKKMLNSKKEKSKVNKFTKIKHKSQNLIAERFTKKAKITKLLSMKKWITKGCDKDIIK